jgi:rhodanese-related sulfurtransferase
VRGQILGIACVAALLAALAGCSPRSAGGSVSTAPAPGDGYAAADSGAARPAPAGYARDLGPEDFRNFILDHGNVFVLDVRMPMEWDGDLGHLDRAILIPAQELEARLSELPPDRDQPIAVYCRLGLLAPQAGRLLAQHGYREVVTLVGGLAAYRRAGF